jgi:hypothetical protein
MDHSLAPVASRTAIPLEVSAKSPKTDQSHHRRADVVDIALPGIEPEGQYKLARGLHHKHK